MASRPIPKPPQDDDNIVPWWDQSPEYFEPPVKTAPGLDHALQTAGKFYDVPTQAMAATQLGAPELGWLATALSGLMNVKRKK